MTPFGNNRCTCHHAVFFSNNIIPDFQRKAKNMLFNIAQTKPAMNFTPGQFIDQIPGYMVKFDKIYGKNDENIEGVFVHKKQALMKISRL
jgi:lipopolysaccharide export system permease protein